MTFEVWATYVVFTITLGESLNCVFPRIEEDYSGEGLVCQWEKSDFNYSAETDEYILKENDSDDNYFEAKSRKRYWEKN